MNVQEEKHEISASPGSSLLLNEINRERLWGTLREIVESHLRNIEQVPVSPVLNPQRIRSLVESFHFKEPVDADKLMREIGSALIDNQVHTSHPSYFGLFNPAPTTMSIFADALVAALNPQLAAWSHSPLAVEIEAHLVRSFAGKIGYSVAESDGCFTTGGAEANQTALLSALYAQWPAALRNGLSSIPGRPTFYVSSEGHHSFLKAARVCGLGDAALRQVPVGEDLRLDLDQLRQMMREDRLQGSLPFMIAGTAGATGSGAIDPLRGIATVARQEGVWFHVDAAWGGAAMLVPELRGALEGIAEADSITLDAHKWLSVSMAGGMFLTRHREILGRLFSLQTAYMPKDAGELAAADPYTHSLQWSRRFTGLKLFLSLAVAGWDGYAKVLQHQTRMGELLRARLRSEGWQIVNDTSLPLVCFTDVKCLTSLQDHGRFADAVVSSGKAWISTIQLGVEKQPALRACITNYKTEERHIEALVLLLRQIRERSCCAG